MGLDNLAHSTPEKTAGEDAASLSNLYVLQGDKKEEQDIV